ncbi:MAG: hypothetical protein ABIO40_07905 [Devosia sp.]
MADRETIIETGDGGAAAVVAGFMVVAMLVVGFFVFFGAGGGSRAIDIDVPRVTVDVTPDGQ